MLQRLYAWWTKRSDTDVLLDTIEKAKVYEEWEAAAFNLDEVVGYDLWYVLGFVLANVVKADLENCLQAPESHE
jgi:hypothetical protein